MNFIRELVTSSRWSSARAVAAAATVILLFSNFSANRIGTPQGNRNVFFLVDLLNPAVLFGFSTDVAAIEFTFGKSKVDGKRVGTKEVVNF
jgi:hypothetical protein